MAKNNYRDAFFVQSLQKALETKVHQEFKFDDKRRWRFDFAIPEFKIAIEQEGGVWSNGRHTRGSGFVGDMEKYNRATELGWRILRYTPSNLNDTVTLIQISNLVRLVRNGDKEKEM